MLVKIHGIEKDIVYEKKTGITTIPRIGETVETENNKDLYIVKQVSWKFGRNDTIFVDLFVSKVTRI